MILPTKPPTATAPFCPLCGLFSQNVVKLTYALMQAETALKQAGFTRHDSPTGWLPPIDQRQQHMDLQ